MNTSLDGYEWTPDTGLKQNLLTLGAIRPLSNVSGSGDAVYDAIVIGAGYAGLTAARDLALTGASVLLLEARDRIGGRTFTTSVNDHLYEMGGTYVHWAQPNVWREIARYQLQKRLEMTIDMQNGLPSATVQTTTQTHEIPADEQAALFASALGKFINIDGLFGKFLMPFPHNPLFNPAAAELDKLALQDRLDKIRGDLSEVEFTVLETFLATLSGAKPSEAGMFTMLQMWAFSGYSADGMQAFCTLFKLKDGQSSFARKFFDEAMATGQLFYAFNSTVASIDSQGKHAQVTTTTGQAFQARNVICTIPHNVLETVKITPALSSAQQDVISTHHVNKSSKVHADVQPAALRNWIGFANTDNKLIQASGEAVTPDGDARLVCFGSAVCPLHPADEVDNVVAGVKKLHQDAKVKRLVFHDWAKDKYANGGWSWVPPHMVTTRDVGILREPHGSHVYFSSADWAAGWKGTIDGAIEDGTRAAKAVQEQLQLKSVMSAGMASH